VGTLPYAPTHLHTSILRCPNMGIHAYKPRCLHTFTSPNLHNSMPLYPHVGMHTLILPHLNTLNAQELNVGITPTCRTPTQMDAHTWIQAYIPLRFHAFIPRYPHAGIHTNTPSYLQTSIPPYCKWGRWHSRLHTLHTSILRSPNLGYMPTNLDASK